MPAPLGTSAGTLTGQTIPIVLSQKTWGISPAPLSPGTTLRTTDYLLRRQHTATGRSSTEATLTKPAPLQNKSAECKHSQSCFKHTTDHPFQLLVQGDQYAKNPPEMHRCFCISLFSVSHSFAKDLLMVFLTNNNIIINCKIITEFTDWEPARIFIVLLHRGGSFLFYIPLWEQSQKRTPMLSWGHSIRWKSSRNHARALPKMHYLILQDWGAMSHAHRCQQAAAAAFLTLQKGIC